MAFPGTALPVRSQVFIGNEWIDFADSTLIRDPIRISRGVPDAGIRPDPAKCNLSLKNRTGDLSPRKPTGLYYGLFGTNTPLRVVLDEADDDFNRTSSNGWGTSSSGQAWATSGGLASAYAVSGGNATIAISAVNSARVTALNVSLGDCDVAVTFKPGVVATGAAIQMASTLRYQDDSNMYFATLLFDTDSTVSVAIVKRVGGVNTTLAITAVGYYTSSSQWRLRAKICGRVLTVRAWDALTGDEPSTFDTWAADTASDAILTAGKIGTRMLLQTGNTNTLNVTVTTSGLEVVHHRYNGEVPQWPVDWDLSGNDVWTPVEAAGILRRVNKSAEVFSAVRRALKGVNIVNDYAGTSSYRRPKACWPLEEDSDSTVASSGLPDGQPMTILGAVDWASVDAVVGSDALPDMMSGTATLVGSVPIQEFLTGSWTVGAVFTPPTLSSSWTALSWRVSGAAFDRFELRLTTGGNFELYGFVVTTSTLLATLAFKDLASRPTFAMVAAKTSGADATYEIVTTDQSYTVEFGSALYTAAGSVPGYPTEVSAFSVAGGASDTAGLGHVTVWDGWFLLLSDATGADIINGIQGNAGEMGHERLTRLFQQEGFPLIVIGDESDAMGPQRSASLPDLVDDILVVDKGLPYEARDEAAVVYLCRRARYNLSTTLALTYGTAGHVAPGFKPTDPDRDAVNDLTIKRDGGASGRYEKRTGRKSVNPQPEGAGRYPRKKTLPLYDDSQPYQHAAWEVNVATFDEPNYATLNVNMAAAAQFGATTVYEQAKRLDVGSRLTVASVPAWLPPDLVDMHALGLLEVIGGGPQIGAHHWAIGAQTVPAGPYTIGTLDTASRDKLASAGCELMITRNSSDTTFTVHTTVPPKWKTGAGLSIPMLISGEKVTATTIANVTASFVGVGTSDHDNNAAITPGLPASWQPGDALYLFTGIRNSPTGFPNAPDETWDLLLDMGNAKLFGKYAQSGESIPTVTFTAGTTNATTSGTIAAFRGVGLTVHRRASQLNASAQNIAYPGLPVVRDNCLVLVLGWKQDDWTSVATLAGFSEIGEPSSTTGDDQGLVWDYVLQSTAASIPSGSLTVTGGTSQINRGGVIALGSDVQTLTVTRSGNTVAKLQTARTPITGYQSLRLGL